MQFASVTLRRLAVPGAALLGLLTLPAWQKAKPPAVEPAVEQFQRLVWLNNWIDAAEMLQRDTKLATGLPAAFADAVMLRGNLEKTSLPNASARIAHLLRDDAVRVSPELRLQLLAIKGDIEFQIDLRGAEAAWEEARSLAISSGSAAWANRAKGELGTIAFLRGQVARALNYVAFAYLNAEYLGDVAAQIRYRTALGEGLAEFGRSEDALKFFERALNLARATPGAYFPFTAFIGKAKILARTGRADIARRMLLAGLDEARVRGFAMIREPRDALGLQARHELGRIESHHR